MKIGFTACERRVLKIAAVERKTWEKCRVIFPPYFFYFMKYKILL